MQYQEPSGLPEPDSDSNAHRQRDCDFIAGRIEASGGSISFAEYMQHALYAPGLGYYVAGAVKFGEDGDFVTAPEISKVFGRVLARASATRQSVVSVGRFSTPVPERYSSQCGRWRLPRRTR